MAKKSFLLMTLMMAMLLLSSVRVSAASTPIPLTGEYIDPHKGQLAMTNLLRACRKLFRQQDGNQVFTSCVPPLEDSHLVRK